MQSLLWAIWLLNSYFKGFSDTGLAAEPFGHGPGHLPLVVRLGKKGRGKRLDVLISSIYLMQQGLTSGVSLAEIGRMLNGLKNSLRQTPPHAAT